MKFRSKLIVILIVLSCSMVFTACKKEVTDSLKRVENAGILIVVGSGGYPPFNYMEDGKVIGFDVDTGTEIAKRLGVELNYVTSDWDGLTEGLRNKRYDAILGSMAITEERQKVVNFTLPYYYSGAQLFVNKHSGITDVSQMSGKKIAVTTGTNFVQDAEKLDAVISYYQDDNATLMELINGRVDGVITDRLVGLSAMKDIAGGDKLVLVGELLRLENMGIAINKDDTELLDRVNEILQDMHDDGALTKISEEWLGGVDISVK